MSNKELIINISKRDVAIAYTEEQKLVELHRESGSNKFNVGDIYLAKVQKVMNGLNAAFVNVGYEKDAFLHYLDLGAKFASQAKFLHMALNSPKPPVLQDFKLLPEIEKKGKISEVLKGGQTVLVQIAKEPISTKGPRLTSEISIAGRNLVLMPFSNVISVSKKIAGSEERKRLDRLIQSIKPDNFGVIVRTVAKNRRVALLDEELRQLVKKWEKMIESLPRLQLPAIAMGELNKSAALLRDILSDDFTNIYTNDKQTFEEIREYIATISPEKEKIVKYYNKRPSIFDYFGVSKQIKSSFGKTVTIQSGAYLIIEETEALTVIDVNSGNRSKKVSDQETNAVEVNMIAAGEIARQLRLRDIGGIIVIDFIDMRGSENRVKIFKHMKELMKADRTKHSILPLSKFGLMQITRQRVRPATDIKTVETCPTCDGTGEVAPAILFADEILNHLEYMVSKHKGKVDLHLHPYIASYLRKKTRKKRWLWFFKYFQRVRLQPEESYGFMEYNFFAPSGEKLRQKKA
ncbi:MAG: ribonuclease E/G [Bacteroidia bacterium]|nr:MAG: ribonuclease E/G [Bacteroidia bacterium]